jgi:hypothetical protein
MFSCASFLSLQGAMTREHGAEVSVFAILASMGSKDFSSFDPYGTRELCLQDTRLDCYIFLLRLVKVLLILS